MNAFNESRAAVINAVLKRGQRVRHMDYGPATITKIKKDGTIWIKTDDGTEGTVTTLCLRRLEKTP